MSIVTIEAALAAAEPWRNWTHLPPRDNLLLLVPEEFIVPDGYCDEWFAGDGRWYSCFLVCAKCDAQEMFEVSTCEDGDSDLGDEMYQLCYLDDRMRPFWEQHSGCKWQMPLPGDLGDREWP